MSGEYKKTSPNELVTGLLVRWFPVGESRVSSSMNGCLTGSRFGILQVAVFHS